MRKNKLRSAGDVKNPYVVMPFIMRATGLRLRLAMNGVMINRTTLSLFVPMYRFFTKINKRHYTKLLLLTVSYSE
jgi:hypothetical protein